MSLIVIDPGNEESGFVKMNGMKLLQFGKVNNDKLLFYLQDNYCDQFVIEMVASYGMPVGASIFDTVFWTGRFYERVCSPSKHRVYRKDVKLALCGTSKAKDTNIKQRIIDIYGGKDKAVGGVKCKRCKGKGWVGVGRPTCRDCDGKKWEHPPGPLYSVKADVWAALAVALTFQKIGVIQ